MYIDTERLFQYHSILQHYSLTDGGKASMYSHGKSPQNLEYTISNLMSFLEKIQEYLFLSTQVLSPPKSPIQN